MGDSFGINGSEKRKMEMNPTFRFSFLVFNLLVSSFRNFSPF